MFRPRLSLSRTGLVVVAVTRMWSRLGRPPLRRHIAELARAAPHRDRGGIPDRSPFLSKSLHPRRRDAGLAAMAGGSNLEPFRSRPPLCGCSQFGPANVSGGPPLALPSTFMSLLALSKRNQCWAPPYPEATGEPAYVVNIDEDPMPVAENSRSSGQAADDDQRKNAQGCELPMKATG